MVAEGILIAAKRWLLLLASMSVTEAGLILKSTSRFADLTWTQYQYALEWLRLLGFDDVPAETSRSLAKVAGLSEAALSRLLLERALEAEAPAWLVDADILIRSPCDLPADVTRIAAVLGVPDDDVFFLVRGLHAKVDMAARALVGGAGELQLLRLLERSWPGSTTQVSAISDSYGYDIALRIDGAEWHLEVKSTTRRGRLVLFLTRNEYVVSVRDARWRLVVVGLNEALVISAIATVPQTYLTSSAPMDQTPDVRWASARYRLHPRFLQPGLNLATAPSQFPPSAATCPPSEAALLRYGVPSAQDLGSFAWQPLP